ncbi:TPA: hypothetical protein UL918_000289 [Stenotrophomonas maltophilia]|nr:hypothetical protein [Stenotrophomonas maltophilia]HEL7675958.1 hypothetical protein [Stenotrophomonas maltophilia]
MSLQQEEAKRAKVYGLIKTICDGVLALTPIAGGPAIVLLVFDPSTDFVPYASRDVVIAALVVAGLVLPLIPAISFLVGVCPQKMGRWPGVIRFASILLVICASGFLNFSVLKWHDAKTAESIASSRRIDDRKREQSAAEKKELRELIEAAVAAACGRPKGEQ